jgi:hypothetical protein
MAGHVPREYSITVPLQLAQFQLVVRVELMVPEAVRAYG